MSGVSLEAHGYFHRLRRPWPLCAKLYLWVCAHTWIFFLGRVPLLSLFSFEGPWTLEESEKHVAAQFVVTVAGMCSRPSGVVVGPLLTEFRSDVTTG